MTENYVRTIYGANLQTCLLLNKPLAILPHTTINESLGINTTFTLGVNQIPTLGYAIIGNGGFSSSLNTAGLPNIKPVQHKCRDSELFSQIPFVLRTTTNDLTSGQTNLYRLRKTVTIGTVQYVAYYAKVLDLSGTSVSLNLVTIDSITGVTTTVPFVPSINDLNPTPQVLSPTGQNVTTGQYLTATAIVPFNLSSSDISELLNVAQILYGDPGYANIGEIGICSGVDTTITGTFNGVSNNYTEVGAMQIATFISAFVNCQFNNNGANFAFDIGPVEALMSLTNVVV